MRNRISFLKFVLIVQILLLAQCSQNKFRTVNLDLGNKPIKNVFLDLQATFPEGYNFERSFISELEYDLTTIGLNLIQSQQNADGVLSVTVNGKGLKKEYVMDNPYFPNQASNATKGTFLYTGAVVSGTITIMIKGSEKLKLPFRSRIRPPSRVKRGSPKESKAPFYDALEKAGFHNKIKMLINALSGRSVQPEWIANTGKKVKYMGFDTPWFQGPMLFENVLVVYNSHTSEVIGINCLTGKKIWKHHNAAIQNITSNTIYCTRLTSENSALLAIDAISGEMKWKFDPERKYCHKMNCDESTVYYCFKNEIYALSAEDGTIKWHREIELTGKEYIKTLIPAGNNLILRIKKSYGDYTPVYHIALNSNDGRKKWQSDISGYIDMDPNTRKMLIITSKDKKMLFACSNNDGKILWKKPIEDYGADDVEIYFSNEKDDDCFYLYDNSFQRIKKNTGKIEWKFESGENFDIILQDKNDIYLNLDNNICRINKKTGKKLWSFHPKQLEMDEIIAYRVENLNLVGNAFYIKYEVKLPDQKYEFYKDGPLVKLDRQSGKADLLHEEFTYDIQFIKDDQIIASHGSDLFGLDPLTGDIKWLYMSDLLLSDKCAVMKDTMLYELYDHQYILAIDSKTLE